MVSIVDKPCSLAPMVRTSGVSRRVLALYFQDPMFLFEILSKPDRFIRVYSSAFYSRISGYPSSPWLPRNHPGFVFSTHLLNSTNNGVGCGKTSGPRITDIQRQLDSSIFMVERDKCEATGKAGGRGK